MEKKAINLLQKKGAPPTFWEKLYDWVTNTARVVVIVVELFVLGAFGWRFWLDRRVKDLEEEIRIKGEVLKSLTTQEAEVRELQSRIDTYKNLWAQSSNLLPVIQEVDSYISEDIKDLKIDYKRQGTEGDTFTISGQLERSEIDKLENKITDSEKFKDKSLSSIEKADDEEDIWKFIIDARITYDEERTPLTQK
jgi:hypothetical protein